MRTDIYARLSQDDPRQTSIERQIRDCRNLAESRGGEVVQVHEDVDLSAYSGVARPGYDAICRRVATGQTDLVIIWKIDRLARRSREFLAFVDLCEQHGVSLVSCNDPIDTSTPVGRVIVTILAAFAELESGTISMRVRSALDHAARAGRPHAGGARKWGYDRQMNIVDEEAAISRECADRLLRGESPTAIARDWNERGLRNSRGTPWRTGQVMAMVTGEHLAGLRVHRGEVIGPGDWTPILDHATHEAVKARFRTRPRARRVNLLTGGLLRCGRCGEAMVGHRTGRNERAYRCPPDAGMPGCGHLSARAEPLEAHVRDVVLSALRRPEVVKALASASDEGDEAGALLAELAAIQNRMEELAVDFAEGLVPRNAWLAALEGLSERQASVTAGLESAGRRPMTIGPDVEATWDERDLSWRRELVSALFERIEVKPAERLGSRFDLSRVNLVWRG